MDMKYKLCPQCQSEHREAVKKCGCGYEWGGSDSRLTASQLQAREDRYQALLRRSRMEADAKVPRELIGWTEEEYRHNLKSMIVRIGR